MTVYQGDFKNNQGRVAIVAAEFNTIITKNLVEGAKVL